MNFKSYPVVVDKDIVLKHLGYKDDNISNEIIKEVEMAISESYKLIKPNICYDKFDVKYDEKTDEIILQDGSVFKGDYVIKNLKDADYIIMAVATVGDEMDKKIKGLFDNGDYFKGFLYDTIASDALEYLTKSLWQDLMKEAKVNGFGITHRLCPGDSRWDIKDQKIIFKNLDASKIGVVLNDSFMMNPIKSSSIVYGIGKNVKTSLVDHDCDECELVDCIYRHATIKKRKINVNYNGGKKELIVNDGVNLLESLIENGINVPNVCGGHHTCGKCLVKVDTDQEISITEKRHLKEKDIELGMRLSCFINVDKDLNVYVPLNSDDANILTEGNIIDSKYLNPRVKHEFVKLNKPSLDDQRGDFERLKDAIGYDINIPFNILKVLPNILEKNDYDVSCVIRRNEVLSINNINANDKIYGVAIDIGTTTVAAYLYDLKKGRKVDVYSSLNPQKAFGADVISRINYTITNNDGLLKIHKVIIDEINKLIMKFTERNTIKNDQIYEVTLAGNTTMIHLALNVEPKNIANTPFIPGFTSKMEIKAYDLGVDINKEGYVISLPMVASYVGADTIAAILSSRMYEDDEISLLLDIGTNGEIVLGNKDKLVSCSAAAGPAFEGAGIRFGIGGIIGAIDHVDFSKRPIFSTIGDATPKGICGSGVVDCIGELVKHGIIDMTGRILLNDEITNEVDDDILDRIKEYDGETSFLLDEENGIYLTQKDVRQIQLAKGAISAGVKILIKELGINIDDIKNVYFAGGFGNYLSISDAVMIGLIPKELKDRVKRIGNAAGSGAIMALLSDDELNLASHIKNKVKYIELSSMPAFQEEFMDAMYFGV